MILKNFKKGAPISCKGLMLLKEGKVELTASGKGTQKRKHILSKEGDFWSFQQMDSKKTSSTEAIALCPTQIYNITDADILKNIPIVRWKLLEQEQKRF